MVKIQMIRKRCSVWSIVVVGGVTTGAKQLKSSIAQAAAAEEPL